MATSNLKIHGIIPALILCNDGEGTLSEKTLERQLGYLLEGGVHGVFVNGSTGEGAVLSTDEKAQILRMARKIVGDRVPLYAVCLQPSTGAVLREIHVMADIGASCVAAVTPYYYPAPQESIIAHFTRIADESPLPLMLYNIPQYTHCPMTVETVVTLSGHPNIVGLKDSSGDFTSFLQILLSTDPSSFACVQGSDLLDSVSLIAGAKGVVTGLGNVRVEHYVEMYNASVAGDLARVFELQKRTYAIAGIIRESGGKNISAIKAGAELLGRGNRRMKTEALTLSQAEFERVRGVLVQTGVL